MTLTAHERVVDWIDSNMAVLPPEEVDPAGAVGRVLAARIEAAANHPSRELAELDGFALAAADTLGASDYNPLPLKIEHSEASLARGRACSVASGEPLPEGADTVVPILDADLRGGRLEVFAPVAAGQNVIASGREARRGDRLLEPGRVLRPADVALLIELGSSAVSVVRRPRVRVMVLQGEGTDAGGPMVRALASGDGGVCPGPERIDADRLVDELGGGQADLVLVIGGSGFGGNDHAAEALAQAGEVLFRGVAINPGETTTVGRVDAVPVVLLPGPPLASLFAYDAVAGRAVRRLVGRGPGWPYGTRRSVLSRKIASSLGRLECCRVRLLDGRVEPIAVTDGRTLSTAVQADGFVPVPASSEGFAEGDDITVYLYDRRF